MRWIKDLKITQKKFVKKFCVTFFLLYNWRRKKLKGFDLMNGSENGFAGALFFSLIALGAILKIDDVAGLAVAAVSAIAAATSVRRAIINAAEAAEDDHQRIEIQFQQLRQKINEGYTATAEAMNAVTETSNALQENLQGIRSRLAGLDNLTVLTETVSAVGAALKSIEDSNASTEINVRRLGEKFSDVANAVEKNSETVNELSKNLSADFEKLQKVGEENKSAIQTEVKLLGVVGQLLKNPATVKNLETLQTSLDEVKDKLQVIEEIKNSFDAAQEKSAELVRLVGEIASQNNTVVEATANLENATLDSADSFKAVGKQIVTGTENLTSMFDDVRKELSTLTKKLDAYNGLTRATLEQYSNLTEQDVRILEKISERINAGRK